MSIDIGAIKRKARRHFKRHYILLVVLCAVSIYLGTDSADVVSKAQSWYDTLTGQVTRLDIEGIRENRFGGNKIIEDLISDNLEAGRIEAAERIREMQRQTDPHSILGRSRGVFASLANNISSGNLFFMLGSALHSIVHSQQAAAVILVLLSAVFYALVWIFFRNMSRAVLRRAFMETRIYEVYPLSHLMHFRLVKRWNRAATTLLLQAFFEMLWNLTIIGGVIKHYSYFLVPFIVAENPDIRPREAIDLSRRMMNGHKWECFLLELSFIGWRLLGSVTFGAVDVLWAVPYEMAAFTEYAAALRREAREKGLPGSEALNDETLFSAVDETELRRGYAGVTRVEGVLDEDILDLSPVKRFFVRNFGIWVGSLDEKKIYSRQEGLRVQTRIARLEMAGKAYPERLNPLWDREAAAITGRVSYLAPCTVWSLVAVFFAFSILGWLWEVSLHLITQGRFVNRGMLHGPWLPIYGGGVVMIAILLYRFRRRAPLEALLVVLLCGFVEYMTSYMQEIGMGLRWWDYTGYFLNLNGRICGEGLAVFGVGGMVSVYFLVPLIDSIVTRARPRVVVPVCIALMLCFTADLVYSLSAPNVGPGVTDYDQAGQSASAYEAPARESLINSSARLTVPFAPAASCKFLDLPPASLRNLQAHLTQNSLASRPTHLISASLDKESIRWSHGSIGCFCLWIPQLRPSCGRCSCSPLRSA